MSKTHNHHHHHHHDQQQQQPELKKKEDPNAQIIRDEIMRVGNVVRQQHPFLERHQDFIGFLIQITAAALTIFCAWCTWTDNQLLPYPMSFFLVAFATSIIHEMEHDLIHNLYFSGSYMNDFLMLLGWLMRPNLINPWSRRRIHFHHHKASGTASDLEEQGITNGEAWGLKRLLMSLDGGAAFWLRPIQVIMTSKKYILAQSDLSRNQRIALRIENATLYCPLGWIHFAALYSFIAFHVISHFYGVEKVPEIIIEWMPLITKYLFALGFPNTMRQFFLVLVSSNMHYFGDIEVGDVMKQCQVWQTWITFPLDLFTFNFGSTHGIHHFVVRDTFYIRQMMAPHLYDFMREHGVRFNDFACMLRANRYAMDYKP